MAGLWTLIKLILRRDRIKLPLWIVGFVLLLVAMVPLLQDVYGDPESLVTMYATLNLNPAMLFMVGPMDEPTFGAFMMVETLLWWGLAIAFINTLLIVRHTRHNEEIGTQELLLSGQVHRAAGLVAALIVAFGVNGAIAVGIGVGMEAMDPAWGTGQSWLYAIAMGAFGFVWAAIAAVVVQLVESGRSANGMLAGLIGVGFLLRGAGDFLGRTNVDGIHEPAWLSALSPFGWLQATRPLTMSEWWPLVISGGVASVAIIVSLLLLARRDVGAGLLPSRAGIVRASRFLRTPLGLAWHLQKNVFTGWFIGLVVMVGTIALFVPQMGEIFDSADGMRQTIEAIGGVGALIPSFMSAMISIACLMVFGYAIHALGRLRSEESSGSLESVLATKLSRLKWIGQHLAIILGGSVVMLMVVGLLLSVMTNAFSDYRADIGEYVLAALSYAPVLLAFVGIYVLLFGVLPRLAGGVVWLYFGFVAFALWLGPIVQLEQWIMNLSLMEHLATPPLESIDWLPLSLIAMGSLAGLLIGVAAFCKRDIHYS